MTDDDDRVIVVGSGPCGATAAERLLRRGVRVVLLDAGERTPPGLLARVAGRTVWRHKDWRQYFEHRHASASDPGVVWASSLSLGGLSNYWTSAIPRYAPDDFTEGARIDERFAWPVSYDELEPYYDDLEPVMGLVAGEAIHGVPSGRARYPQHLAKDWAAIAHRAREHGHGVGPLPMARGRPSMVARRGTEFSSYHAMIRPLEGSPLLEVIPGAYVVGLDWSSSSGCVEAVEYVDRPTGDRHRIRGRAVVVAAGAIDSTVILLRSLSDDFPCGLGNSAGLIGRYLHDHPREWWPANADVALTALAHPVYISRADHDVSEPLMAASMTIGLTDVHLDRVRSIYGGSTSALGVQVLGTMVPTDDVGVRVDPDQGCRPVIRLRYDDNAVQNMVAARDRFREVMGQAGVKVSLPGPFHQLTPGSSVHYGGTVRMHANPEFGVLDRWNRMYDVSNVAVVDASCFPTGPEKNPTLTAMALAGRAADRLADDLEAGRLG